MTTTPPLHEHPDLGESDTISLTESSVTSTDDDALTEPVLRQPEQEPEPEPDALEPERAFYYQPKFIIVITLFILFLSMYITPPAKKKPEIIYAKRYSAQYLHRPAASPVITETLKDGRIRLRGTHPPPPEPTKTPEPIRKAKARKKKRSKTAKPKASRKPRK